eukprot:1182628-Prorocentrum_minimum.AAC.2
MPCTNVKGAIFLTFQQRYRAPKGLIGMSAQYNGLTEDYQVRGLFFLDYNAILLVLKDLA